MNNILNDTGYYFNLTYNIKYIALALALIIFNIYIAILVPSIKASTTSVMQGIRGNKQIKYKRKAHSFLGIFFPVEGKLAIKNVKRNKSKYRVITVLLVVCITAYITISTYIAYEKETADIIAKYDTDAEIFIQTEFYKADPNNSNQICRIVEELDVDYRDIIKEYEKKYNENVEVIEYRGASSQEDFLLEPKEALIDINYNGFNLQDGNRILLMSLIALNDKEYAEYIKKVGAQKGDIIVYNSYYNLFEEINENSEQVHTAKKILASNDNLKLKLIQHEISGPEISKYELICPEIFNKKVTLTDEVPDGFKEIKTMRLWSCFYRYGII